MLSLLRRSCPFPTIDVDGNLQDGLSVSQPAKCRKCIGNACRRLLAGRTSDSLVHLGCDCGYSLMVIATPFGHIWVNGVYVPFKNTVMSPKDKKANRRQKVPWEQAEAWAQSVRSAGSDIRGQLQTEVREAIAGLHDITTAVGVVFRNAEAIVSGLPGYDDYERMENADPPLKALLKSVNLLHSRLKLASIVANAESANYGQRHRTPVYRLFHLMVRLFEQEAARRKVHLQMTGRSYNELLLYDSFETLPLVLIDNAVKYSQARQPITVRVDDLDTTRCQATIESYGPIVPSEDRQRIFEKGFRSRHATDFASAGSGLGLYIARVVADANGCLLSYSCEPSSSKTTRGRNTFSLDIRGTPAD